MTVAVLKLNIIETQINLNKMDHTTIIFLVVTLSICSTLGVYSAIRVIKKHSRPVVNTLNRSGDIELLDYIEPTQPQQIYNYPDLLQPQIYNYPDLLQPQFQTYERLPSYHTVDVLPSYYLADRWYIYSCLENNINLDYISIFSLCFLILILILKFRMRIYFIYYLFPPYLKTIANNFKL